jgi:hypothetical protein
MRGWSFVSSVKKVKDAFPSAATFDHFAVHVLPHVQWLDDWLGARPAHAAAGSFRDGVAASKDRYIFHKNSAAASFAAKKGSVAPCVSESQGKLARAPRQT